MIDESLINRINQSITNTDDIIFLCINNIFDSITKIMYDEITDILQSLEKCQSAGENTKCI